ncbi:MAG: lysozyme inhibitor LprI family protein [Synechococcaceae cyanobacterium]
MPPGRRRSIGTRGALGGWLVLASLAGPVSAGAAPAVAPAVAPGLAPASPPTAASSCQAATTTLEMQACLARLLQRADQDLEHYLARALRRLNAERDRRAGASARASSELAASQHDWRRFRDRYCQAVWSSWSGGTIRGPKLLECRLILARERQRRLWADFLSFPDGSPPLLPEPPSSHRDSRP